MTTGDAAALLFDTATGLRIGEPFRTDDRAVAPDVFLDTDATIELAFPMPDGVVRPDGLEIALSMPEGVVVWDIDPGHQFEFACRIAGRDLSESEWRTYLDALGEPQSTCGFD